MKILDGTITNTDVTVQIDLGRRYVIWLNGSLSTNNVALQALDGGGSYGTLYTFTESEAWDFIAISGTIRFSPAATASVAYRVFQIAEDPSDISETKPKEI